MSLGQRISVATVTYESAGVIGGWLDSVAEHVPDAEVIVVDNGSRDDSAAIAHSHRVGATVVEAGGNLGFARGCNLAARAASRAVVWFLNPDARIARVDAERADDVLSASPFGLLETANAAGEGVEYDVFEDRGELGEWLTHVTTPLWPRALGAAPGSLRRGSDWASGASLLVDRTEFDLLGGFDESIFLLYEDRELSWRARHAGLPVRTTDAIVTDHEPGGSSSAPGLGVARRAWAALSWIEFVAATRGDDAARGVASGIVRSMRWCAAAGGAVRLAGDSRLAQRLSSAGDVEAAMYATLADRASEEFYVRAARALSRFDRGQERR